MKGILHRIWQRYIDILFPLSKKEYREPEDERIVALRKDFNINYVARYLEKYLQRYPREDGKPTPPLTPETREVLQRVFELVREFLDSPDCSD